MRCWMGIWTILCWRYYSAVNPKQTEDLKTRQKLPISLAMTDNRFYNYEQAIRQTYPNATNIRLPKIVGTHQNVLLANIDGSERVCKFNSHELVQKNEYVSKIYQQYNIPAPIISTQKYGNMFWEEYKIIPGISLFEAVQDGIGSEQIRDVYRCVVEHFATMCNIEKPQVSKDNLMHIHNFARLHVAGSNNSVLGNLFMVAAYFMNMGRDSDMGMYHFDITPKNIILDNNGCFRSFIDMDSVGLCNKNFAFGVMATKYKELGLDYRELMDMYEDMTSDTLGRERISATADINAIAKTILWKRLHNKRRTK